MGTLRDLQFALQLKIEELRQRDALIDELELELDAKDELIRRLQEELDRFRATVPLPGPSAASAACSGHVADKQRSSRRTVICEPVCLDPAAVAMVSHKSCDKSQESQRRIRAAMLKNDLLKNLGEGEMRAIAACMRHTPVSQGCCVIQEGTGGARAYVLEEGRLDVTRGGVKLFTLEPDDMFGELSLLYDCTHAFSVSAQTDSQLWAIERRAYQSVLAQTALSSLSQAAELLNSVPFLQSLPEDAIVRMSDLMEEAHFSEGDCIVQQGAAGDTFYIISKGQVNVTEKGAGHEEQRVVSKLSEGHWFGEKALWGEELQPVNVVAAGDVTCWTIDRDTFKDAVTGLAFDCGLEAGPSPSESDEDPQRLSSSTLSDFQIIATLAVGEFGHVDLVQLTGDPRSHFAMRVLRKTLILGKGQRDHVLEEGRVLRETRCPFVVRLHKAFSDAECLYMLTEACLGGDLCALLKDTGHLDECSARFYAACVVEALDFLHGRGVVYRDVKPENVVLDGRGYAKLIGSRCLKRVEAGKKTWTFCGTPGYMAPEIILTKGHGASADLWSLGVFLFELLSGRLPFGGSDPLKVLAATVGGIDRIDFPRTISKNASSLIKKLCRSSPCGRLGGQRNGAKDIQKHKWFKGFNWAGLCGGTLNPPAVPKVQQPVAGGTCDRYAEGPVEPSPDWDDWDDW